MLCGDAPLIIQQFRHNVVSPKFPAALSFLNLLEAISLFVECLIFPYDFKNIEHYFSQLKCCVKRASNYFIVLIVSSSAN